MKVNAVFEGGGMRGIGIVGALSCLESWGYEWDNAAGTSSGALIASLVIAGYKAKDIKRIMVETDFMRFLDKESIQKIPLIGTAIGIIKDKGIYSGNYIERWISDKLKAKGIIHFADVMSNGTSKLKIVASDITNKRMIIFPDDLYKYEIDPFKFEIAKAVRASISVPFYFKPYKLTSDNKVFYIVDGAVSCNFPISLFDDERENSLSTIGFKFLEPDNINISKNTFSYLFDIAATMSCDKELEWQKPQNLSRTILIPTLGIELTDFNISKSESLNLYKSGYRSAVEFMSRNRIAP